MITSTAVTTIVGVGDVMLGRGLADSNIVDFDCLLEPSLIAALQGDLVTANLECVIGQVGAPNPISHAHFRTSPVRASSLLRRFHVVNLANNHIFDFGDEGVASTLYHLNAMGVRAVGVGKTPQEAYAPVRFQSHGRVISVFGATTVSTMPRSGAAFFSAEADDSLKKAISDACASGDFVVLHLHAGGGDFIHPAPAVRELQVELLTVGADIIFGHHPHVIQGWHVRNGKSGFFSLGDFIFDKFDQGRDRSLIARASLLGDELLLETVAVKRNPDFSLSALPAGEEMLFAQHLEVLNAAIVSGDSDRYYWRWYGSPLIRLLKSVCGDFRHGGIAALVAKLRRVDHHRVRALYGAIFQKTR